MAKFTSQSSSKSKTANSRIAKSKATTEEKKPRSPSRKMKSSKSSTPEPKEKALPAPSLDSHISVVSTNGHGAPGSRLTPLDPAFDLQERVRDMVKLAKEQGYV